MRSLVCQALLVLERAYLLIVVRVVLAVVLVFVEGDVPAAVLVAVAVAAGVAIVVAVARPVVTALMVAHVVEDLTPPNQSDAMHQGTVSWNRYCHRPNLANQRAVAGAQQVANSKGTAGLPL